MRRSKLTGTILAGIMAVSSLNALPGMGEAFSVTASAASKLAAPANVKAAASDSTSVKLTWSAVKGADAYKVYMYNSDNGSYESLKNVAGTSTTIKDLVAGRTYRFKVAALVKSGGSYSVQTVSEKAVVKTLLPAPTNFKAASVTANSVKLTWSKVTGASAYGVYWYDSASDSYKAYKTVTGVSCNVTGLTSGATYKFKVAALVKNTAGSYNVQTKSSPVSAKTASASASDRSASFAPVTLPKLGVSGDSAVKTIGLKNYQYVSDVNEEGVPISGYIGTKTVNGGEVQVILLTNTKDQLYATALIYDGTVSSFSAVKKKALAALGKASIDMDMFGMEMYIWGDGKTSDAILLMGADSDDASFTVFYDIGLDYAPDELKEKYANSGSASGFGDLGGLFEGILT